jgi:hypothetical protein
MGDDQSTNGGIEALGALKNSNSFTGAGQEGSRKKACGGTADNGYWTGVSLLSVNFFTF